jgi:hypothetical protein
MGQGPFLSTRKSKGSLQKLKIVSDVCETHGDDRFFVLYADNTVPLQSLSDIPIEP